jgi:arsenate reductase (glutaredoxin)
MSQLSLNLHQNPAMTTSITLYGIPNCDTVKKSRAWFDERGIAYQFHDFKKHGVPQTELQAWVKALGWQALVNKQGTTWRKLDAAAQSAVVEADSAIALMLANPSVIKRPVVVRDGQVTVSFAPEKWR